MTNEQAGHEAKVTRVALVSCVKTKQKSAMAAKDLYISPFFKKMRRYAEQNADHWFILSAEHGVLHPDEVIGYYERTLNKMPKLDRMKWAEGVQRQLLELLPPHATVVFLAGVRYRENVIPFLESHGFTVPKPPMYGLRSGQQQHWLDEQMRDE